MYSHLTSVLPDLLGTSGKADHDTEGSGQPIKVLIDGIKYDLVSSTEDLLMKNTDSSTQAARIILTIQESESVPHSTGNAGKPGPRGKGQQPLIEFAAHIFSHCKGSETVRSEIIVDKDAIRNAHPTAPRASGIPTHPAATSTKQKLTGTYHAYIAAINARAMSDSLSDYCHPFVTHNGRPMPLGQYRRLMEDAQEAISDLEFTIRDLLVDEEQQQVAARLEFTGTPMREWAGVEPSGKEVRFGEQVFYWLEEGKIREVVSLVDLDGYREQMSA